MGRDTGNHLGEADRQIEKEDLDEDPPGPSPGGGVDAIGGIGYNGFLTSELSTRIWKLSRFFIVLRKKPV
jgi:hypothetical protein